MTALVMRGCIGLICVWSAAEACAETMQVAQPSGVTEWIQQAVRDNKDLQAARYAVDIARARLIQAGQRANPTLAVSNRSDFLSGGKGEYSRSLSLSQAFPVTGRLLRQQDVARVDIELAQAEVADAERKLAGEVANDIYRIVIIEQRIAARDELIAANGRLARICRDRFKAAEVSELDVNTVQIDLQRLNQERAQLQAQRDATLIALSVLLGKPATAPLSIEGAVPSFATLPGLSNLQQQALATRPDLRSATLGVDRADAQRALAEASRWEDWTASVELSQDRLVIDGAPRQSPDRAVGISVSIPFPLKNSGRGAIAEADASRDQASARIDALRLAINGEVATAHAEASRSQAAMDAIARGVQPLAARNEHLAENGYRQGLVPLADVVQAQRQQSEAADRYLDALDAYLQALVRLHTAVGDYVPPSSTEGRP